MRPTFFTAASLLLSSASVLANDFAYGSCDSPWQPLLSDSDEIHGFNPQSYDRAGDSHKVVTPVPNPQVDRQDYHNLVPSKDASLFYAEDAPNAQYAAILNFTMDYPTIILENVKYISTCNCVGSKISLSFEDAISYDYATRWPKDNFVVVTNSPGCSSQQDERGVFLIYKVEYDASTRSVACFGEPKKWDQVADTMSIGFGPARPGHYAGEPETRTVTRYITQTDNSVTSTVFITTVTPIRYSTSVVASSVRVSSVIESKNGWEPISKTYSSTKTTKVQSPWGHWSSSRASSKLWDTGTSIVQDPISTSTSATMLTTTSSIATITTSTQPKTLSSGVSTSMSISSNMTPTTLSSSSSIVTTTKGETRNSATTTTSTTSFHSNTSKSQVSVSTSSPTSSISTATSKTIPGTATTVSLSTTSSDSTSMISSSATQSSTFTTATSQTSSSQISNGSSFTSTTSAGVSTTSTTSIMSTTTLNLESTTTTTSQISTASSLTGTTSADISTTNTISTMSTTTLNLGSTTTTVSIPAEPTQLSPGARVALAEVMKVIKMADDGSYFIFPILPKIANAPMPQMAGAVFDVNDAAAQKALAAEINSYPGYDTADQIDQLAEQALVAAANQPYSIKPGDNFSDNFPTSNDTSSNSSVKRSIYAASRNGGTVPSSFTRDILNHEANIIKLSDVLGLNLTKSDLERRDADWWVDLGFSVLGFLGEAGCKICEIASDLKDLYDGIKSLKEAIEYLRDGSPAKSTGTLDGVMGLEIPPQTLVTKGNGGKVSVSDASFKVVNFHVEVELLVRLRDNVVVAGEIKSRWDTNSNLQFQVDATAPDTGYYEFSTKDVALNSLEAPGVFKISPKLVYLFGVKYSVASAGSYKAGAYSELRGAQAAIDVEQKKLKPGYSGWKPSRIDLTYPSFKEGQAATFKPYIKSTIGMSVGLFNNWYADAIAVSTQTWFAFDGSVLTSKESNECKKGGLKLKATLDTKADMSVFKSSSNNLDTNNYQLGQRCSGGQDEVTTTLPVSTTKQASTTTSPAAQGTGLCGIAGWAKNPEDWFNRFDTFAQCKTWCIAQGGKSMFSTPKELGGHCMCYKTTLSDGLTQGPGSIPNFYDTTCADPNAPTTTTTTAPSPTSSLCGVSGWAKNPEDWFYRFDTWAQCKTWCVGQGGKSFFSTPKDLGGHCMCYKTALIDGLTQGPGSIPNFYDASCPDPTPATTTTTTTTTTTDRHAGPTDAPANSCPSGYTNRQFFTNNGRKYRVVCGKELDTSTLNRGYSAAGASQWQTFDDCARGCSGMGYPWCSAFVWYPDSPYRCVWLGSGDNAIKDNPRAAYAVIYIDS